MLENINTICDKIIHLCIVIQLFTIWVELRK